MSTPDKLLEPDRHHWMAFPLDRPPGDTALLEPELESAPPAEARREPAEESGAREASAEPALREGAVQGAGPVVTPPVRERVFNPELKQATQKVLKHPAESGSAADAVAIGAVAIGAAVAVTASVAEAANEAANEASLDDSEFEAMIHDDEASPTETAPGEVEDDELAIDEFEEAPEPVQAGEETAQKATEQETSADAAQDADQTEGDAVIAPEDLPAPADLSWLRPVPPPMPAEIVKSLFHLFEREDVNNQDFLTIMEYMRERGKADALAGMLFDPIDFVYRLYLHDGIDPHTRKNIFFALNDEFLDSESPISILRFADYKGDFFFSKRFSTNFFKTMQGAVLLNLNVYELPGYFMLFYRDLSARDDEVLRELSESIVRDLVPLVQRLRRVNGLVHYRTTLEDSRDNYTLRLYQLLKELSHSGKDPIRVIHVSFRAEKEGGAIRPYLIQICERLRKVLGPRERVAILPPGRLSVMIQSDEVDAVLEVVKAISADAELTPEWKVMRYPESGRNLLNYLR